ncbi:hypothetical protein EC973_000957 [Apophysomyces ossiformis]|uniref:Uncharacterized protein n=1 Tax=Apophysomyces ossiformis TaxID=679940 RepID=A0A8H7ES95_9FUNG|nr:hypothetical protein EC973_000957 [Apophysomyces ossiformis]
MRPLYEILEVEQRVQVQRLFDENILRYNKIPKIPAGMHFDGIDAQYQAIELVNDDISSPMVMLRDFYDQPYVEHTKQHGRDLKDVQRRTTVDVDAELEFAKNFYFNLGAQAAWKERKATSSHCRGNIEQAYDVVYVIYKELFLPDGLLQPTAHFKEAITNALQVGNLDSNTYYALQDVFQRFGYYYPTRVQIGGKLILPSSSKDKSKMQATREFGIKERFESYIRMCEAMELNDMSHVERNKQGNIPSEDDESATAIVQYNQQLVCHFANGELAKSIARTKGLSAVGGDGTSLLWNDLNMWIYSVGSNQVIIRRKDLRPLYHVLDKWQRQKVRQTYKNIVLTDDRIRYNCPLLLTAYEQPDSEESESIVADHYAIDKSLYRQLLEQEFDDFNEAIEYCRSACKNTGFSISKHKIALDGDSNQFKPESCIWSIQLDYWEKWRFRFPESKHGVRHNHGLNDGNGENYNALSGGQKHSKAPGNIHNEVGLSEAIQSSMILEIKHTTSVTTGECKTAQHVYYGDRVYLRLIDSEDTARMTLLNDELLLNLMKVGDLERLSCTIEALRDTYLSASGCLKGVADKEDEEITVQDPDSDYLWKIVRYQSDSKNLENKTVEADFHSSETEACDLSYQDCVRSNDVILFESQAALEGSERLYLGLTWNKLSCFISESPTRDAWKRAGWNVIRNIYDGVITRHGRFRLSSELETELKFSNIGLKGVGTIWADDILKSSIDMIGIDENESELENDDDSDVKNSQGDEDNGASNVDRSTERKIEMLQARADDGDGEACYELAVRLWETRDYQKALDMYEKAAQLWDSNAYYALGNLYHSGFSSDHFTLPQNSQLAFVYHCVGSTHPSYPCMLKVAQYYEKGYNKLLGVHYDKARQWYMTANYYLCQNNLDRLPILLAMGKLEHSWAMVTSDPLEAKEHRQDAFNMFHQCMEAHPYAKFMVAMYHLYGWGIRQPDPGLAFNMLLSLVESGLKEVPLAIAKCYEEGVGVERDPVKAAAYREMANKMPKE